MDNWNSVPFETLLGKTITGTFGLEAESDQVVFGCDDGANFRQFHHQDCCEHVRVVEVIGDPEDLLNSPILLAEEVESAGDNTDHSTSTWTFYKLSTIKGSVTIRWLGESNGYYSEAVYFEQLGNQDENISDRWL